jgi:hypothetical protein
MIIVIGGAFMTVNYRRYDPRLKNPLEDCLEAIGLSSARYFHWIKRQVRCELMDQPSCPRVSPTKLTPGEITKIKDLYTSKDFLHYSVLSLSWLCKKTGQIIASASTWSRVIR